MNRTRIWIAASALLAVLVLAGYATAHVLSGDAEVRISARRLDDGRTEFALQQRSDGEWGDRVLPRARFFPADAEQDQWLNSTPLSVESEGHESDDMLNEELRSAKEELAATQQAIADAQKLVTELEDTQAEATATPMIVREGGRKAYDEGRIVTQVEFESTQYGPVSTPTTMIRVRADGEFGLRDRPLTLSITCQNTGAMDIEFTNGPSPIVGEPQESGYVPTFWLVSYRFVPTPESGDIGATDARWEPFTSSYDRTTSEWYTPLTMPHHTLTFFWTLYNAEQLEIVIVGEDKETMKATFTLDGVFDTPVQPNIDRCGDYY